MKIDAVAVRKHLKSFDFETLFREHLGWDNHQAQLDIALDGRTFQLVAVAQKRGFVAFICPSIPDRPTRLKIDHQITKSAREHFVIYADQSSGKQVWQWVRREPGKPLASRDHSFDVSQSGDPLIQRLDQIAVSIDEEEDITVVDVAGRARSAFDVDKVTKKFYERFKAEHAAFLKLIKGIKGDADLKWYTSLMLNRLMFVYFIQKKGFLDGDTDYLRNRMTIVQQARGKDKFQSFYSYFLLRLFHDGLGKSPGERKLNSEMEKLLGKVPYLNGGFFEVHQLEERNTDIDIPDRAFEKLFDFFDQFRWHLDERPLRTDNEINPDVVGYIFEKYINQKQMGAYYTKEDITEYISKNTIIPFLFETAQKELVEKKKECASAFKSDGSVWRLLRDDPDRYIYPAVRHGVVCDDGSVVPETDLPDFVQTGMHDPNARMHDNRYNLEQASADDPIRLVTETWREYTVRRQRCLEIREKLRKGKVHQINDLITLNLDIWQFARDAIVNAETPELLRAFWHTIAGKTSQLSTDEPERGITILDPTCGSGAFLFSALRILETLYSDCLERMARFIEDIEDKPHHPKQYSDFKNVLAQIAKHPNERYFVLKSIIINNLFGVDIMEEAVEICKLRLFLKLVAQVERVGDIEPLPDIDFNIRSGNTLVGFVSLDQVKQSMQGDMVKILELPRVEESAAMVERAFRQFRAQQTIHGGKVTRKDKQELRTRLAKLDDELDRYMAGEYGIRVDKQKDLDGWKASHQPFHWFVEFYGIMHAGGFDVIIGNPPYVEVKSRGPYAVRDYKSLSARDLYAYILERALNLSSHGTRLGFIVPLSCFNVERFSSLQDEYFRANDALWISSWSGDAHPARLFEGVDKRLQIVITRKQEDKDVRVWASCYRKWYTQERQHLFNIAPRFLELTPARQRMYFPSSLPKIDQLCEFSLLDATLSSQSRVADLAIPYGKHPLYYTRKLSFFLQFLDFIPEVRDDRGKRREPSELKSLLFKSKEQRDLVLACLSSSFFYWFTIINSDCRNLNKREVVSFPIPTNIPHGVMTELQAILRTLMKSYKDNSQLRTVAYAGKGQITVQYFNFRPSKPIIDQLDQLILPCYGLSGEDIEFVINYCVKYRLGTNSGGNG
jgi:hypothetical protein